MAPRYVSCGLREATHDAAVGITAFGVLALTLPRPGTDWQFLSTAGTCASRAAPAG